MSESFKHIAQGQQPSASEYNRLADAVESLLRSAGTQSFRDSRGVHTRRMPAARGASVDKMKLTAIQTAVANSITKVDLDSIIYDDSGGCDITNHKINITVEGTYLIAAVLRFASGATVDEDISFAFTTQGAGTGWSVSKNIDAGATLLIVDIRKLTPDDYIELWVTNYHAVDDWNIISGGAGTILSVTKFSGA